MRKKIQPSFICLLLLVASLHLAAQQEISKTGSKGNSSKSYIFIGTQVPLQFTAGYEYRFSSRFSARAQAGFISKPYSGFVVNAMQAFGMDKYLAEAIKKSFKSGTAFSVGPNYYFGRNHVGLYGQYMHLKGGGITPADALSIYYKKDFSQFDVTGLPAFEFTMQSDLANVGVLYGYRFKLRNPKLSIDAEAAVTKIVASKTTFSSNRSIIDQTSFARNLYADINKEMKSAYWKHGIIPTINVYLNYQL